MKRNRLIIKKIQHINRMSLKVFLNKEEGTVMEKLNKNQPLTNILIPLMTYPLNRDPTTLQVLKTQENPNL